MFLFIHYKWTILYHNIIHILPFLVHQFNHLNSDWIITSELNSYFSHFLINIHFVYHFYHFYLILQWTRKEINLYSILFILLFIFLYLIPIFIDTLITLYPYIVFTFHQSSLLFYISISIEYSIVHSTLLIYYLFHSFYYLFITLF